MTVSVFTYFTIICFFKVWDWTIESTRWSRMEETLEICQNNNKESSGIQRFHWAICEVRIIHLWISICFSWICTLCQVLLYHVIKLRRMVWVRHVAHMGQTRNIGRILVRKLEWKVPLYFCSCSSRRIISGSWFWCGRQCSVMLVCKGRIYLSLDT
jgi:hypothetical protein